MIKTITTILKTLMFVTLCASLFINYLVYYGKLDMFAAGVSKELEVQTDFVSTLEPTLAKNEVKPVNLYKNKKKVK